jgi:hypothetical protein
MVFLPAVIIEMQRFFNLLLYLIHRELVQICGFIQQKSMRVDPTRAKTPPGPSRPGQIGTFYVDNGDRASRLADHFAMASSMAQGPPSKERWPSGYIARMPS